MFRLKGLMKKKKSDAALLRRVEQRIELRALTYQAMEGVKMLTVATALMARGGSDGAILKAMLQAKLRYRKAFGKILIDSCLTPQAKVKKRP